MVTGEDLRLLRILKGIKQTSVANKIGISQQAYSKLEKSDSISKKKIEAILEAIDCNTSDIKKLKRIINSQAKGKDH
jgi:transcriptional regulator with XRE-family HTH domain